MKRLSFQEPIASSAYSAALCPIPNDRMADTTLPTNTTRGRVTGCTSATGAGAARASPAGALSLPARLN